MALFKIQKLLGEGLRLRTACDLEVVNIEARLTGQNGAGEYSLPDLVTLGNELPGLIDTAAATGRFEKGKAHEVKWTAGKGKKAKKAAEQTKTAGE